MPGSRIEAATQTDAVRSAGPAANSYALILNFRPFQRLVMQGAPDGLPPGDRLEEANQDQPAPRAFARPGPLLRRGSGSAKRRRKKQNHAEAGLSEGKLQAREEGRFPPHYQRAMSFPGPLPVAVPTSGFMADGRGNGRRDAVDFRSAVFDGRQLERGPRIEDKSPFRVAAASAVKRSIFEPVHGDLVMGFDRCKAHLVAANETFHRRPPGVHGGRVSRPNDRRGQKFLRNVTRGDGAMLKKSGYPGRRKSR
jgi:hypothetical protein